jgi:hypothetical protein
MRHLIGVELPPDVPPLVVVERRHQPDRRMLWRGGRRDGDWINRPAGAWKRVAAQGGNGAASFWLRLFQRQG